MPMRNKRHCSVLPTLSARQKASFVAFDATMSLVLGEEAMYSVNAHINFVFLCVYL